jgi:hypothetical protein
MVIRFKLFKRFTSNTEVVEIPRSTRFGAAASDSLVDVQMTSGTHIQLPAQYDLGTPI